MANMAKIGTLKEGVNRAMQVAGMLVIMATTQNALSQDFSNNNQGNVNVEQVDKENQPNMPEVKKFIENLGVLETEEEKEGFYEKRDEKLQKDVKKEKYEAEIWEIYTFGLDEQQTALLIVALLDSEGETPLGKQAVDLVKADKTLSLLHKNNKFSIENDKTLTQLWAENEQATRENEQATRENEQATRENEQATRENEQATRENEQATRELEKSTKELEKSTKELELLRKVNKIVSQRKK